MCAVRWTGARDSIAHRTICSAFPATRTLFSKWILEFHIHCQPDLCSFAWVRLFFFYAKRPLPITFLWKAEAFCCQILIRSGEMKQLSHSTGSVSLTRFLTTPRMLVIRTTGVLLHESCGSYSCGRRNLTLSVKNQPEERPRLQHRLPQCQDLPRRSRWYGGAVRSRLQQFSSSDRCL